MFLEGWIIMFWTVFFAVLGAILVAWIVSDIVNG